MGKKIVLAVFGGIALLGLVMSIVGGAMGGEIGGLRVDNGEMIYHTSAKSVNVGKAPPWANGSYSVINWNWDELWDEVNATRTNVLYSADAIEVAVPREGGVASYYEDAEGFVAEGTAEAAASSEDYTGPGWQATGENMKIEGAIKEYALNFTAAQLVDVEIDIEVGYLVVQTGTEPGLSVRGPLTVSSDFSGGTWSVNGDANTGNITPREEHGEEGVRFFSGNRDITTVVVLTLPQTTSFLDASMNLGVMTLREVRGQNLNLNLQQDMGSVQVQGGQAQDFVLDVNMGFAKISGMQTKTSALNAELGTIEFVGEVQSSLYANCDIGRVTVKLNQESLDQGFKAKCNVELGSITVDTQTAQPMADTTLTLNDQKLEMDLNCAMGSIDVQFAQ